MVRILKDKSCIICGGIFTPTSSCQKYCSSCRETGNKIHRQEYRQNNIEIIKQKGKEYHIQNKEKRNKSCKQWYLNNREKRLEQVKKYRENNRILINEKDRIRNKSYHRIEYRRNKRNTDIHYKLSTWLRYQIYRCLNNKKDVNTNDIILYSKEQLKQRIEMNFKQGMSWDNHGKVWHIDHRKPLSLFNYFDKDGNIDYNIVRQANSLCNLKPLFIKENLVKSKKIEKKDKK